MSKIYWKSMFIGALIGYLVVISWGYFMVYRYMQMLPGITFLEASGCDTNGLLSNCFLGLPLIIWLFFPTFYGVFIGAILSHSVGVSREEKKKMEAEYGNRNEDVHSDQPDTRQVQS